MKMAERIRRARRKAKLSQTELAEIAKVRRSAVSNWESISDTCPTMVNLIAIARACDVSLEWLGTGRGRMEFQHDPEAGVPAVDADLVELPIERELIACFRAMPMQSQSVFFDLAKTLARTRSKK